MMKCPNCGQETNDVVCSCGYRFPTVPASPAPQKRFCGNCGAEVTGKFCVQCGSPVETANPNRGPAGNNPYQYQAPQNTYSVPSQTPIVINNINNNSNVNSLAAVSPKSKILALVLCLIFGYFGFHRFYVGKIGTGLIWMFTGGMFMIGWVLDLLSILGGGFRDSAGLPLKR